MFVFYSFGSLIWVTASTPRCLGDQIEEVINQITGAMVWNRIIIFIIVVWFRWGRRGGGSWWRARWRWVWRTGVWVVHNKVIITIVARYFGRCRIGEVRVIHCILERPGRHSFVTSGKWWLDQFVDGFDLPLPGTRLLNSRLCTTDTFRCFIIEPRSLSFALARNNCFCILAVFFEGVVSFWSDCNRTNSVLIVLIRVIIFDSIASHPNLCGLLIADCIYCRAWSTCSWVGEGFTNFRLVGAFNFAGNAGGRPSLGGTCTSWREAREPSKPT